MHPAVLILAGVAAAAPLRLSPEKPVPLVQQLAADRPTLFLFYRPNSAPEQRLAAELQREFGALAGLRWIPLKTGAEPLARRYDVRETPVAVVYDRRGRVTARASDPDAVRGAVRRALGVPRIDWAEDDDPRMDYVELLLGRRPPGGIMRTMTLQPEWLDAINKVARRAHFADGALDKRTKELIATHVSALNRCKF